jgi:hypothetical protein
MSHENLSIAWWNHLDSGIEYLAFQIKGKLYMMHKLIIGLGVVGMVTWEDWELACENMKMQCIAATTSLIDEQNKRFPHQELM